MTKRQLLQGSFLIFGTAWACLSWADQKNQIRFPTSEDVTLMLRQADSLLAKGRTDEALDLFVEILKRDRGAREKERDQILELPEGHTIPGTAPGRSRAPGAAEPDRTPRPVAVGPFRPRRFEGVSIAVQARLRSLSAEHKMKFRERFDYRAKAAFDLLLLVDDEEQLDAFYQEQEVSSFGAAALRRLADLHFEKGNLERAAEAYGRLETDHVGDLPPEERRACAKQRLLCLAGLGRVAELRELCAELGLEAAGGRVCFGGELLTVPELLARALKVHGERQLLEGRELHHIRGDSGHQNSFEASLWIGPLRFRQSYATPSYTSEPQSFNGLVYPPQMSQASKSRHNLSLPVVIRAPRKKDGQLVEEPIALLSTGSQLVTLWLSDGAAGPRVLLPNADFHQELDVKVLHGAAVSKGILVTACVEAVKQPENYKGIPIKVEIPIRKLCAVDTRSWRILWNLREILKDTRFAKASFPTPPVIVGDTVFASVVLIEGFVHSYVVALDLWSGRLKWATWICSGQVEQTMFGEHAREPLATSVTVSDNIVYHSTSLGAVAALDGGTGKPLWLTTYEQVEIEAPKGYYPVPRLLGWANNPPIAAAGVVVVTPLDSDHVVAFDGRTGDRLWQAPRRDALSRGELEFLLGVQQDRLVLAGEQRLESRELRSGRLVWRHENLIGQRISGRGLLANGRACVSIYGAVHGANPSRVAQYDLLSGQLVREDPLPGSQGGDLVLFGDSVLIVGAGTVVGFENQEQQRRGRDF